MTFPLSKNIYAVGKHRPKKTQRPFDKMEGTERDRDREARDIESRAGSYGGMGRGRGGSGAMTDDLEISIYDMRRDNLRDDCSGTSTLSVEAQIKLEADNAIKYRTCSWHKVWEK